MMSMHADPPPFPKRCRCPREPYTAAEWTTLTFLAVQGFEGESAALEMRNCPGCGCTFAIELSSEIIPMVDHVDARTIIVTVCDAIGFPKPALDDGLSEWADESLDTTLQRGAPQWQRAYPHMIEALEAALLGHVDGVRDALIKARDIAKEIKRCACHLTKLPGRVQGSNGKIYCVVCHGVV